MNKTFNLSIIVFIGISSLLFSCRENQKRIHENEVVVVPEQMDTYNSVSGKVGTIYAEDISGKFKIYTLINTSCATCLVKLKKWENLINQVSRIKDVSLFPICFSYDDFQLLKFGFENNKLAKVSFPLLLDHEGPGSFRKQNKALISKSGEFTALTDASNHILFMGNPIEDAADSSKFIEYFKSQNN